MGFLTYIKDVFSTEPRADFSLSSAIVDDVVTKASKDTPEIAKLYNNGQRKDADSAHETTFATSDLIYRCVDFIAKTAAQAELRIGEVDSTGKIGEVKDKKLLEMFNYAPNNGYTWFDFKELVVQSYLVSGNAYISLEKLSKGYEMWVHLPPSKMEVVPSETDYIEGYLYNKKIAYSSEEMFHIKNTNLGNEYYGKSAIERLVDYLLVEGYGVEDLKHFYQNASVGQGVLTTPNPMSRDQLEVLSREFKSKYAAKGERYSTVVLSNGLEYKSIKLSPKESMLLDSFAISEHRVLLSFGLNSIVLGGRLESYTTHPELVQRVVFNSAIRPILRKIEASFSQFFKRAMKNKNIVCYFDLGKIPELQESLDIRAKVAKDLFSSGLLSHNEAREMIDMPRIDHENADKHFIASYLVGTMPTTIEDLVVGQEIAPANEQPAPVGSTNATGGAADGVKR